MRQVEAEGTNFLYAAKDERLGAIEFSKTLKQNFENEVLLKISNLSDVRLTFFRKLIPPNDLIQYYMIWLSGEDVCEIDRRVYLSSYSDKDFYWSIRTHYQVTKCFSCGSQFETLVVDPGDPYPNAPRLLRSKISRLRAKSCTSCGHSLRQLVVKFI